MRAHLALFTASPLPDLRKAKHMSMLLRRVSRALILFGLAILPLLGAQALFAESFPMTGQMRIKPPSAGTNRLLNQPKPGATTLATVNQTGVAPRTITLPSNVWSTQGSVFRVFPGFAGVAQLTSTFADTHATAMFAAGGGPGTVNWCPRIRPSVWRCSIKRPCN